MIKYVSLFSGIEAAKVAFDKAGIPAQPLAFFEIERQQSKLLKEKYPDTPNYGDVRKFDFSVYKGKIDFLCGGSPCQSFSKCNMVNRDHSGTDLMAEYIRAVKEAQPDYFLYENVPQAQNDFWHLAAPNLFCEKSDYRLTEDYEVYSDIINSAEFGFIQPRKRFYCVGVKRKLNIRPYIHVRGICEEKMKFSYLPPTAGDKRRLTKCTEFIKEYKKFTYSNTSVWRNLSNKTSNMLTLIAEHPILEVSKSFVGILDVETHEKLQGFPAGYTDGYSFSRRIQMIGNSWHVGTVAEIFRQMFRERK